MSISGFSIGQTENDKITQSKFNREYLEHLVKIKVDSVRKSHGCEILINDSILFKASNFHARFMSHNLILSHKEIESDSTRTPQMRAEYFGAKNYLVGENVLFSAIGESINKKGKLFNGNTYGGMAAAMVDSWVNSPGHFKNIITENYSITGLSIEINWKKKRAYACQKFAEVLYKYSFNEDKNYFPYSNYTPTPKINSFPEKNQLIDGYPYKLSHDNPQECNYCTQIASDPPFITLEVKNRNFILKIQNSEYVKQLLKHRKSGFAVEIVEFNDYMCGNPDYYEKPSRRNGQSKLNGELLQPLYRKELLRGFKKRKRQKQVKYVDYILSADSIPFFQRFGRYKMDKYSSEYFQIKLGKVPKTLSGLWQHDLIYIQNNEICHVDYFTGYCGELSVDSASSKLLYIDKDLTYEFIPESKPLKFEIQFEKGKHDFSQDDFDVLADSLFRLDYSVDSIKIEAYCSVEGDSLLNDRLQRRRAETINDLIQNQQENPFNIELNSLTQWEDFYEKIKSHPHKEYRILANKSKDFIRDFLSMKTDSYINGVLEAERRSLVTMYTKVLVNDDNLEYYVKKEWNRLADSLNTKNRSDLFYSQLISELINLYYHSYSKALERKLSPQVILDLKAPQRLSGSIQFIQLKILVGYYFYDLFSTDDEWTSFDQIYRNQLITQKLDKCWEVFIYNSAVLFYQEKISEGNIDKESLEFIMELLKRVNSLYTLSEGYQREIDNFYLSINSKLLNQVFTEDRMANSVDASTAIFSIRNYHEKYETLDSKKALELAKMLVYYDNVVAAVSILSKYRGTDSIDEYLAVLEYNNPLEPNTAKYYDWLVGLENSMDKDKWCNLFLEECKLSFQAFDHEELRDLFCQTCMDKNNTIMNLIGN